MENKNRRKKYIIYTRRMDKKEINPKVVQGACHVASFVCGLGAIYCFIDESPAAGLAALGCAIGYSVTGHAYKLIYQQDLLNEIEHLKIMNDIKNQGLYDAPIFNKNNNKGKVLRLSNYKKGNL